MSKIISTLTRRPVLSLFLVGLAACLPLLALGALDSHDRAYALLLYKDFSQQLFSGTLYPRWMDSFNNGLGAPVLYYYSPLPFYFLALIDMLSFFKLSDMRILGLGLGFAFALSSLCAYAWLRQDFERKIAFCGALAYALAPYHLMIDVYNRGTITELMAYIWLPLILLSIRQTRTKNWAWLAVAVSYAGLILSAIPAFMFATPLFVLYASLQSLYRRNATPFLMTSFGLLIGFALCGGYMITALSMSDYIFQERAWTGKFDPRNWLLCLACSDAKFWFFLRLLTFSALAQSFLVWALWRLLQKQEKQLENHMWIMCAGGALFFMSALSLPLWNILPVIERIQFPWRLFMVTELALAYMTARYLLYREKFPSFKASFLLAMALCIYGVAMMQVVAFSLLKKTHTVAEAELIIARGEYFDCYVPRNVTLTYPEILSTPAYPKVMLLSDPARPIDIEKMPHGFRFRIEEASPGTVKIRQFAFPTWEARIAETDTVLTIRAVPDSGEMLIDYPGGAGTVELRHRPLAGERLGWRVSQGGLAVLLAGMLAALWRSRVRKDV